jgi:hypothetical protein
VQVDAPFVFRADEPPDPLMMANIRLQAPAALNMWPAISPPAPPPAPELAAAPLAAPEKPKKKRGWFRSFLAAIFR